MITVNGNICNTTLNIGENVGLEINAEVGIASDELKYPICCIECKEPIITSELYEGFSYIPFELDMDDGTIVSETTLGGSGIVNNKKGIIELDKPMTAGVTVQLKVDSEGCNAVSCTKVVLEKNYDCDTCEAETPCHIRLINVEFESVGNNARILDIDVEYSSPIQYSLNNSIWVDNPNQLGQVPLGGYYKLGMRSTDNPNCRKSEIISVIKKTITVTQGGDPRPPLCDSQLQWNTPTTTCLGEDRGKVTISVRNNNNYLVEFFDKGVWKPANNGNNTFEQEFENGFYSTHARVRGCTQSIEGFFVVNCDGSITNIDTTQPVYDYSGDGGGDTGGGDTGGGGTGGCSLPTSITIGGTTSISANSTHTYTASINGGSGYTGQWIISGENSSSVNGNSITVVWGTNNGTIRYEASCNGAVISSNTLNVLLSGTPTGGGDTGGCSLPSSISISGIMQNIANTTQSYSSNIQGGSGYALQWTAVGEVNISGGQTGNANIVWSGSPQRLQLTATCGSSSISSNTLLVGSSQPVSQTYYSIRSCADNNLYYTNTFIVGNGQIVQSGGTYYQYEQSSNITQVGDPSGYIGSTVIVSGQFSCPTAPLPDVTYYALRSCADNNLYYTDIVLSNSGQRVVSGTTFYQYEPSSNVTQNSTPSGFIGFVITVDGQFGCPSAAPALTYYGLVDCATSQVYYTNVFANNDQRAELNGSTYRYDSSLNVLQNTQPSNFVGAVNIVSGQTGCPVQLDTYYGIVRCDNNQTYYTDTFISNSGQRVEGTSFFYVYNSGLNIQSAALPTNFIGSVTNTGLFGCP